MAYPRASNADVDMSMGTVPNSRGAEAQGINGMLVCSYNESHLCSGGRFFAHIEECRKQYEAGGGSPATMLRCPFRSSHHVDANAMRQHIEMCDGYYEWQMLNQKDPPSMIAAESQIEKWKNVNGRSGHSSFATNSIAVGLENGVESEDVVSSADDEETTSATGTENYFSAQEVPISSDIDEPQETEFCKP
ncbi:unnamed protein product [Orchesella dallaii]|uniref:Gametocyte-specific factor 1 n=1 Tax=Orchesella dallaii TaxID=48710 RepID=A0ABP1RZG1_9HEXA